MQVEENHIIIDSTWFSAERDVKRSRGLHLSAVIDFIEGRKRSDQDRDVLDNYAACGFLWERVLEKATQLNQYELYEWLFSRAMVDVPNPRIIRPGEQYLDGVFMTPDGYDIEDECLEEWKFTTKSSKWGITNSRFDRWTKYQIPAYLKAMKLTRCRLRVLYARGDYTKGEPQWVEYMLTYQQHEIDETWDMIAQNAKYMVEQGLDRRRH